MYHVISTLEVSCAIPTLQLVDINDNKIKSGTISLKRLKYLLYVDIYIFRKTFPK